MLNTVLSTRPAKINNHIRSVPLQAHSLAEETKTCKRVWHVLNERSVQTTLKIINIVKESETFHREGVKQTES